MYEHDHISKISKCKQKKLKMFSVTFSLHIFFFNAIYRNGLKLIFADRTTGIVNVYPLFCEV